MKSLFQKYRDTNVLDRCRQYGEWTLPYLTVDTDQLSSSGRVVVERDFQEAGATLVNNLASKLARVLFPTQAPFFQATPSKELIQAATRKGLSEQDLRKALAEGEMEANKRLFMNSGYATLILALKQLIVTGNVLLHRDSDAATITAYGIRQFAVRRDGAGRLLDCVLQEHTTVDALPPDIAEALRLNNRSKYSRAEQTVEKYTRVYRIPRNGQQGFEVSQEVDSIQVGTPGWYPEKLCPWMVPTWTLIPGEHYGRGMVEDYAGGFAKLSNLAESAALYGVEIMKVLHLVGNSSGSDLDEMAAAEMGEWVKGDPGDVQAHEAGDSQKLVAVEAQIDRVTMALARAFMYTGQARDSERTTAYELQRDAQEAEHTLGGTYSTLSGGIQVPLAHILMTEADEMALTGIISGDLTPNITAGIPALGRSSDVQNLLLAANEISAVIPIVQLDERINPQKIIDIILAGRSIPTDSIMFSPEEIQARQQAKAAEASAQNALLAASTVADQSKQIQQTLQG